MTFIAPPSPNLSICVQCRGHIGGMLGGASVAWLLGPHLKTYHDGTTDNARQSNSTARGGARFVDQPPVPWLAYPEGYVFRERAVSDRRVVGVTGTQQTSLGKTGSGLSSVSSSEEVKNKSVGTPSQADSRKGGK
jgi:hypothetical protein